MNLKINYSPEADSMGGGGGAEASTETATETTGSESGQNDSDSESYGASGEAEGDGPASPVFDKADLEQRFVDGEELSNEELDWYAKTEENGFSEDGKSSEQLTKHEPTKPPESKFSDLMKEVGAKSEEEIYSKVREFRNEFNRKSEIAKRQENEINGYNAVLQGLKRGDDAAFDTFATILGLEPASWRAFASQQQTQQPPPVSDDFFDPDEFMDAAKGRKLNEFFKSQNNEIANLKKTIEESKQNFSKYEQMAKQQEAQARRNGVNFKLLNDVSELAELYKNDLGLNDVPIRSAIEQLLQNGKSDEKLQSLVGFLREFGTRDQKYLELSMKEYWKLINFDKLGTKAAQAAINSLSKKNAYTGGRKPFSPAPQNNAASYGDADIAAMISGERDIPVDFFLDEDRTELNPKKAPPKLLEAWAG